LAIDVEALFRKYGPMVLRRCRQLLKDEDKASDAMQETFVRLLRRREQLIDAGPSSLLYRIATNVCLNVLRGERRRPQAGGEELLLAIASVDDHEERTGVRSFLDQLFGGERESTRTMAVLHYVDELTLEETAAQVGLSVSGVRKRLRGLRAKGLTLEGERGR
jgi:RNA polymerase sigma-70 factor (ECF subfamily)